MTIRRAANKPKRECVRGHLLKKVGFYWSKCHGTGTQGVVYLTRRCAACAVEDVQRFRARKALKMGAR